MEKEETMRPPCDLKTPGFDQLPFSSEESQRVIFVNKPRDDNHTIKFCKTNVVPIMDETMRLSSKSLSKPQEESDRSRASQTREGNTVYSVEERNDLTFMNKGSNDNSVNFAVVTIDTVGGMLDNSANTSSQCNISSAEGTEPNSDNNYGQDANVSSSLENHSFIYGKMDNSSSLDTISKNSSHLCIQPTTNVRIDSEPNEDTIERPDPVEGSQINEADIVEDIYTDYSTAESDENSTNFVLDDNDTVGSRLDESANACSEGNNFSPKITGLDNDNSHANGNPSSQMLKSHTSMDDKICNDFLLDAGLKDSSHFSSWPHANVTVDSGPHEDTLGLENNVADNSSVLGTFGMDKTKGKKYSQDENNGPTISKADEEQNVVISKLDNYASAGCRGNPISEEDTKLDKTTYEPDVGIFSSQDEINISRASKTEEQNVLSTDHDSIVIEKESAASSSQGSNGNSMNWTVLDDNYTVGVRLDNSANTCSQDNIKKVESGGNCERGKDTSSSQMLESCTSMVDKTDTSSSLITRSKQPYPNVTVDSGLHEDTLERQKPDVMGLENNVADNSSVLGTFGMDKTKGKKYSHESQDENRPTISKADKEQNALFVSQNAEVNETKYIATSSHEDDNPPTSRFIDYDAVNSKLDNCVRSRGDPISEEDTELDNTTYERDIGICSSQDENNISRASKTEEQNVLRIELDSIVIEKESAASTSQGSNGNSINWTGLGDNYTVGVRLDNSANTSSLDNLSSAEGKEVESGGNCERGMDTSSSQVLKSCTSMVDKTDSSSSLNTQSKQPYLNVTVDSGLHEDSLERQKPDVRGRELHPKNKALMSLTSENYNNKNENLSFESQGEMVPISLKTEEERKLAETNDKNISYGSQDKEGPRGFKTKEQQHEVNVGLVITKTKHINYSNHASEDDSANFSDADRLDNSTNEGRRANTSSPEDTELDKKNNHGREIKIQSNQELLNPTSMGDEMASNCQLDTRLNASAIEDSKLHEDAIEEQKPVRDSECLVEDKTFTDLNLPYGISSDNEPEYQVPKINNITNIDTFLGNEVDFKASETQTLDNSSFVGNQFNCFPSSGTLHMVAASVLKSSKNQKKSSKSQNTNGAKRQSHLKPETKTKRQKSQKLVQNPKSNIQDKSKRVLQPKRGEKAFNETNREKRTPKTYTAENDAGNVKANSLKERADGTRMRQSIESIRSMGSKKLQGILAAAVKWLVTLWMFQVFMLPVDGTPVPSLIKWQQHMFCTQGYDLINQRLAIKRLDDIRRPGCDFMAPAVPYFYNCSELNALVFLNNKTCLEMFTTDLQSSELEYGKDYKGKHLTSVRGELFSDETVKAKIDRYERGHNLQDRSYIQSTMTPTPPSTNGTTSKPLDRPTLSRIIGPLAGIACLILVLVFFVKRYMNKSNNQSPTTNGIELQDTDNDGEDTNKGLLSNGTSETPTRKPDG